ncbi:MAG: FAD:protein FMN transferase [Candidatus Woesearchaeota archaeon]
MSQVQIKKPLFGKEVGITIYDVDENLAYGAIEEAYNEGLRLSKIFNPFDSASELTKLNKEREKKVSAELFYVIESALKICELTDGAYDISLGKLIEQRKKSLKEAEPKCSFRDIKISGNKVILTHSEAMIDLGSIAKGYIGDRMAEKLQKQGIKSGLIDARGDIRVFGEARIIRIQHPREMQKTIGSIKLANNSVATSGDYRQYYGSFENCHIVNRSDAISVTAIAKELMWADGFATALFVLGKESREDLLERKNTVRAMVMDNKLRIENYNGFEKYMIEG